MPRSWLPDLLMARLPILDYEPSLIRREVKDPDLKRSFLKVTKRKKKGRIPDPPANYDISGVQEMHERMKREQEEKLKEVPF